MEKNLPAVLIVVIVIVLLALYLLRQDTSEEVTEEQISIEDVIVPVETPEPVTNILDEIEETQVADEAVYEVIFRSNWSPATHIGWWVSGAHLSPFVTWSHSEQGIGKIFRENGISTPGMEDMAETGATKKLFSELDENKTKGFIYNFQQGRVIFVPGENNVRIAVSKAYPYITSVSMIAPSPDWFIAIENVELFKNGNWVESLTLVPGNYDAGTDSGTEFESDNLDTNPKELITKLRGAPRQSFAEYSIRRIQ